MSVTIDHVSLVVTDIDTGIAFFTRALALEVRFVEYGMTHQIASMLGLAGATCDVAQMSLGADCPTLELIAFRDAGAGVGTMLPTAPGMGHLAITTTDFDEMLERLRTLGARQLGQVTAFTRGRAVYVSTPFGAFLELQEAHGPSPAEMN